MIRRVASRVGAVLAILALVGPSAGCGGRSEPQPGVGAYPVTITDAAGRHVVVERAPRTIVSAVPAATATLRALGVTATVRDVAASSLVDSDALAAADLVVVPEGDAGRGGGRPTIVWTTTDPRLAGRLVADLGLAVGRGPQGVAAGRTIDAAVTDTLARVAAEPVVRVMLEAGQLQALGAETPIGVIVQALRGAVIAPRSGRLTVSAIRTADPEVWISTPPPATTLALLRGTDGLKETSAARNRRFDSFDPSLLAPSPDLPDALSALALILHRGA